MSFLVCIRIRIHVGFLFVDGRHFKPVYGKDLVEAMVVAADQVSSELERSEGDRLVASRNQAATLQGQIDLICHHQVKQDRRISFALAREAEEADGRMNAR